MQAFLGRVSHAQRSFLSATAPQRAPRCTPRVTRAFSRGKRRSRTGTAALPGREKGDGPKAGGKAGGPQRRDLRSAAGGEGSPRRAAGNGASPAAPNVRGHEIPPGARPAGPVGAAARGRERRGPGGLTCGDHRQQVLLLRAQIAFLGGSHRDPRAGNFMNKNQKPVLTGQRFKTRKRDEKEKFEPTVFRDTIVQGLNEAGNDLEAIAKFLDAAGSRLDYRRYADTLFDILVAGSMLAPGGTRIDDNDKTKMTNHCVFFADEDHDAIRNYAQVFNKLIRRYKYLEKAFEDEIKKLLLFLKAFTETEQTKLAMLSGILLANGTLPATILTSLFTDNIVKEGIAASFAVKLFKAWMAEKDANSVTSALRKANLDKRLLELFPANRQNVDHFAKYFTEAGLKELSDFLRVQQSLGTRKELQKELQERLSQECPIKEVVLYVKEEMKRNELPEPAVIGLLWTCVMNAVEWNKKEELVAEQALKHLKQYAPLLAVFSTQGQSELILLQKVQEYCYDNIHFMKAFQKIVVLFYKADVLSEEAILKWYKEAHVAKGKSVFLDQMKKFVEWLQNAEEESESEGEEN